MFECSYNIGRLAPWRRQALAVALLSGLTGCGHTDIIRPEVDLYHDLQGGVIAAQRPPPPGVNDPYPNLGTVPKRPAAADIAAEQRIADQLATRQRNADRTERVAADQTDRGRTAATCHPQPAAPPPSAGPPADAGPDALAPATGQRRSLATAEAPSSVATAPQPAIHAAEAQPIAPAVGRPGRACPPLAAGTRRGAIAGAATLFTFANLPDMPDGAAIAGHVRGCGRRASTHAGKAASGAWPPGRAPCSRLSSSTIASRPRLLGSAAVCPGRISATSD